MITSGGVAMKRFVLILSLCMLFLCLCTGCGETKEVQEGSTVTRSASTMVWKTMEEAEAIVGFPYDLPETVARRYKIAEIRTMGRQMIEVDYCKGETVVCVTKQRGNVKDIFMESGGTNSIKAEHITESISVFNTYEPEGVKIYIENEEYMWTVLAPKGLKDKEYKAFVDEITE